MEAGASARQNNAPRGRAGSGEGAGGGGAAWAVRQILRQVGAFGCVFGGVSRSQGVEERGFPVRGWRGKCVCGSLGGDWGGVGVVVSCAGFTLGMRFLVRYKKNPGGVLVVAVFGAVGGV